MGNRILSLGGDCHGCPTRNKGSGWPQAYAVQRDDAAGILTLRTPYYIVEQDLKQGWRDHTHHADARQGNQPAGAAPSRPASGTKVEPC